MPLRHNDAEMLDRIRMLAAVVEEGSVNRAATRLRIAQPALSRHMRALEDELGGKLLEREPRGVKPTGFCHDVLAVMMPVVVGYDEGVARLKREARSGRSELRVGYLISVARPLLSPVVEEFRKSHPALKLKLHDMSPKEQVDALRAGEIDVALVGQEGRVAAREFYARTLCSMGVCAAISMSDPLAGRKRLRIGDFKGRDFIGVDETQVPGRNQWIVSLCRSARFRPRFAGVPDGIHNVLSLVVAETGVTFLPGYFQEFSHPGVMFLPIADAGARWDFIALWQRGRVSRDVREFVDAVTAMAKKVWE